jgi:uncharacterized protein with ParB-like and HNH nuclease domain
VSRLRSRHVAFATSELSGLPLISNRKFTMAYEKPITIKEAIEQIQKKKYVLPSIQREFVWESSQIEMLFDSIMRDYPISTFLFWHVDKSRISEFQFYEFLQHYHERDATHNPKASLASDEDVIAILDGQQRLTSLYIGLKGTYAEKMKKKRWDSQKAFPKKKLYLNLLQKADDIEKFYEFEFLSDDEVVNGDGKFWFEVGHVLDFKDLSSAVQYMMKTGLADSSKFPADQSEFALNTLSNLFNTIHQQGIMNFYLEKSPELDKVLQIFIRTNSGGTKLSYSDLLLSIATAQWKDRDAREEIHEFVDELNKIGHGFDIDKDFVMKSSLVLGDFNDIKFRVDNFTKTNMYKIEQQWDEITTALSTAVKLSASYGFSRENLTSNNTLIPIAYYLLKIKADESFVITKKYETERVRIWQWLLRVLLKRTFSGQPDSLYPPLRKLINDANGEFPLQAIIDNYRGTNKSLTFSEEDVDALCDLPYGGKFTFSALALLYPELNRNYSFNMDHIFPKKSFGPRRLKKLGVPESDVEFYMNSYNNIANLQLLEGNQNKQKSASDFKEWFNDNHKTSTAKTSYKTTHMLPENEDFDFSNFKKVFQKRRKLMKEKFTTILNEVI